MKLLRGNHVTFPRNQNSAIYQSFGCKWDSTNTTSKICNVPILWNDILDRETANDITDRRRKLKVILCLICTQQHIEHLVLQLHVRDGLSVLAIWVMHYKLQPTKWWSCINTAPLATEPKRKLQNNFPQQQLQGAFIVATY